MKTCPTCEECKKNKEFGPSKRSHDGLQSKCRPCAREYARKYRFGYYRLNKKKIIKQSTRYQRENPEKQAGYVRKYQRKMKEING